MDERKHLIRSNNANELSYIKQIHLRIGGLEVIKKVT